MGIPVPTALPPLYVPAEIADQSDVADYLGVEVDVALIDALNAEYSDQVARCRTAPYNASLREALCRRVARNLAMRAIPLGVQSDGESTTRIGASDPEVRRLEAPYRKLPIG